MQSKYKFFLFFSLLIALSFSVSAQILQRPNPTALGLMYKYIGGDSGLVAGTFNGTPPLPNIAIRNENKAVFAFDVTNHVIKVYDPSVGAWVNVGSGGGGSQVPYTLPYNGNPLSFLGGDTAYHSLSGVNISTFINNVPYATVAQLGGYVPTSLQLTINGISHPLTGNQTWTFATGGAYHLPFNGSSNYYIGGDSSLHLLPSLGAAYHLPFNNNSGYYLGGDSVLHQLPSYTPFDSTSLSNRINAKVNISDTSVMLNHYALSANFYNKAQSDSRYYSNTNPSGFITNIGGLIQQGTGVTLSGAGTPASPYIITVAGSTGVGDTTAYTKGQSDLRFYPLVGNPSGFYNDIAELPDSTGFVIIRPSGAQDTIVFTGGGAGGAYGAYQLPYNGNSGYYLGGDTLYHSLGSVNVSTFINDVHYLTSIPAQSWASITGKPAFANLAFSASWADVINKPTIYSFTGSTTQYTRGDGSYQTFPTSLSSFTNDPGFLTTETEPQYTTNGVPKTRTLSINGVSFDLSANRSWTIPTGNYHLPFNGNSGYYLGGDSALHQLYTGTSSQYIKGNGALATLPTALSQFTNDLPTATLQSVVTNGNGIVNSANGSIITFTNSTSGAYGDLDFGSYAGKAGLLLADGSGLLTRFRPSGIDYSNDYASTTSTVLFPIFGVAEKYIATSITANGNTYNTDSSGNINLGTIAGGGTLQDALNNSITAGQVPQMLYDGDGSNSIVFTTSNASNGKFMSVALSPNIAAFGTASLGFGVDSSAYVSGILKIRDVNAYLNFNSISGIAGYGFRDNGGTMQYKNSGGSWTNIGSGGGGGSGTVTNVSGLSPLFTVANATSTPTFSLSNAPAHSFFGNDTGSSAAPAYHTLALADLPAVPANSFVVNTSSSSGSPSTSVSYKYTGAASYTESINFQGATTQASSPNYLMYSWQQVGKMVTVIFRFGWATPSSNTNNVTWALPSDCPTPKTYADVSSDDNQVIPGVATYGNGSNSSTTVGTVQEMTLQKNSSQTSGYECSLYVTSAQSFSHIWATITYESQ